MRVETTLAVDLPGGFKPSLVNTKREMKGPARVLDSRRQRTDEWASAILQIAAHQDRAAFAKLFGHFAPRVKAFLMRSGASESLAEEATQEALSIVWRKAGLFDPQRASAATWIFTIARNKQLDAIRKVNRPEPEDLPWAVSEEPDPAMVVEVADEQARLAAAIKKLPDRQRQMIEKAFYGDLSHSEIAEITGLPLGTIKSRIRLALERLRHELGTSEK